jgi:hypothetical protein
MVPRLITRLAALPLLSETVKVPAVCTALVEVAPASVAAVLVLLGGSVENDTDDRAAPAPFELLQPAKTAATVSQPTTDQMRSR